MIFTQTLRDLGFPAWTPQGAWAAVVEEPTDACGHGKNDYNAAIRVAVEKLKKAHGVSAVLLNAKIERVPSGSHPSYHIVALQITGDLYFQ